MNIVPNNPKLNPQHPLARNLRAFWHFRDRRQLAKDATRRGLRDAAVATGTLTHADGRYGREGVFDGSTYLELASATWMNFGANSFTVAAIASTTSSSGFPVMVARQNTSIAGLAIQLRFGSGNPQFVARDANGRIARAFSSTARNDGRPHLYVGVLDYAAGYARLYVDGEFDTEDQGTAPGGGFDDEFSDANADIAIGSYYGSAGSFWTGNIAAAFWSGGALSAGGIAGLRRDPFEPVREQVFNIRYHAAAIEPTVISGPYCSVAAGIYSPGAVASQTFAAGASTSQIYAAGAEAAGAC